MLPELKIGQLVFVWTNEAVGGAAPIKEWHTSGYAVVLRSSGDLVRLELWPSDWESLWVQVGDRVIWTDEAAEQDAVCDAPRADVFTLEEVGPDLDPGCEKPAHKEG